MIFGRRPDDAERGEGRRGTGPTSALALALCGAAVVLAGHAVGGCAQGRAVPAGEAKGRARLVDWQELSLQGRRLQLAVRVAGERPAAAHVQLNGVPVRGCTLAPNATPGEQTLRCVVTPLAPGDLRVLVTAAAPGDAADLRRRGLGLYPPDPTTPRSEPAGSWWLPGGWAGAGTPTQGAALAAWLHVGPPDLRAAVLLDRLDDAVGAQLVANGGGASVEHLPAPQRWEPGPGEAIRAYLQGGLSAAQLVSALAPTRASAQALAVDGARDADRHRAVLGRVGLHGPTGQDVTDESAAALGLLAMSSGVPVLPTAALHGPHGAWLRCLTAARRLHPALAGGELSVLHAGDGELVLLTVLRSPDGEQIDDVALLGLRAAASREPLRLDTPPALTRAAPLREACDDRPLRSDERGVLLKIPARGIGLWTAELR